MRCAPQLVTAYVDGELRLAERAAIADHLESCPPCAEQAWDERELRGVLRALPEPPLPGRLKALLAL